MIDDSSSDDDNATIGSKLNIKKVKTTLYMIESKDFAIPEKAASGPEITPGGNTEVTPDAQSIPDTSILNVVSSTLIQYEICDNNLGDEITSP